MTRVPLWVEMSGRRVLVVGGGRVGARRALFFRSAGALVRVASLEFVEELLEASKRDPGVELVRLDASRLEQLRPLVEWSDLVVIATSDPRVNEMVWRLARELRRWVNDATDASRTEIVVPYRASLLGGGVEVAVTSEGRSGVAARHVLERIKECVDGDEKLRVLYEVMWRVKPVLKALVEDGRRRFPVYFRVEEAVLPHAERGDLDAALEAAARVIAAETGRSPGEVAEMLRSVREPVKPLTGGAGAGER